MKKAKPTTATEIIQEVMRVRAGYTAALGSANSPRKRGRPRKSTIELDLCLKNYKGKNHSAMARSINKKWEKLGRSTDRHEVRKAFRRLQKLQA